MRSYTDLFLCFAFLLKHVTMRSPTGKYDSARLHFNYFIHINLNIHKLIINHCKKINNTKQKKPILSRRLKLMCEFMGNMGLPSRTQLSESDRYMEISASTYKRKHQRNMVKIQRVSMMSLNSRLKSLKSLNSGAELTVWHQHRETTIKNQRL